jgi:hypothetical protein
VVGWGKGQSVGYKDTGVDGSRRVWGVLAFRFENKWLVYLIWLVIALTDCTDCVAHIDYRLFCRLRCSHQLVQSTICTQAIP